MRRVGDHRLPILVEPGRVAAATRERAARGPVDIEIAAPPERHTGSDPAVQADRHQHRGGALGIARHGSLGIIRDPEPASHRADRRRGRDDRLHRDRIDIQALQQQVAAPIERGIGGPGTRLRDGDGFVLVDGDADRRRTLEILARHARCVERRQPDVSSLDGVARGKAIELLAGRGQFHRPDALSGLHVGAGIEEQDVDRAPIGQGRTVSVTRALPSP